MKYYILHDFRTATPFKEKSFQLDQHHICYLNQSDLKYGFWKSVNNSNWDM